MRWVSGAVAAVLVGGIAFAQQQDQGRPKPPGEEIAVEETYRSAPGDSLKYTLRWGPGTRANGYGIKVNTQQTNCTSWTGLPPAAGATVPGSTLSYAFTAICTAWDTVTFNATVWSIGGGGLPSKDSSKVQWKTSRRPGMPGPIIVDSVTITAMNVVPELVNILAGGKQQFCPVFGFKTGQWAMPTRYQALPACDSIWSMMEMEPPAYPSVAQQAKADSICINWSATGGSITMELCPGPVEAFNAPTRVTLRRADGS